MTTKWDCNGLCVTTGIQMTGKASHGARSGPHKLARDFLIFAAVTSDWLR